VGKRCFCIKERIDHIRVMAKDLKAIKKKLDIEDED